MLVHININTAYEFYLFHVLLVLYLTTVLISVVVSCLPVVAAGRLFLVQSTKPEKLSSCFIDFSRIFYSTLMFVFPLWKNRLLKLLI